MKIIFFDTETTGLEPDARLVQLAYKSAATGEVVSEYFRPPRPISYGSMAVHHITEKMVLDKPAFEGSVAHTKLVELLDNHIAVAHNAPFDIQILSNEDVRIERNIDTLRLARHLVDSEQYSLQYLRYFLGLDTDGAAHDAHGDVLVLESLFNHLYALVQEKFELTDEEEVLGKMLELTKTPVLLKTFGFGKHIDRTFQEVSENDRSYLEWLHGSESKKNMYEQNEDLVHTLEHWLR